MPTLVPPLERLAKGICNAANARGTKNAGVVIALFKQRSKKVVVDAAIKLAVEKQWLSFDWARLHSDGRWRQDGISIEKGPETEARHSVLRVAHCCA